LFVTQVLHLQHGQLIQNAPNSLALTGLLKETLIQAEAEAAEECFPYVLLLMLRLLLMLNASILLSSNSAIAAESCAEIPQQPGESISVEELSNFAETGELSTSLRSI